MIPNIIYKNHDLKADNSICEHQTEFSALSDLLITMEAGLLKFSVSINNANEHGKAARYVVSKMDKESQHGSGT